MPHAVRRFARYTDGMFGSKTFGLLGAILLELKRIRRRITIMSDALNQSLAELKSEITVLKTVEASAVALIGGFDKQIADAIAAAQDDSAAVDAVKDVLATIKAKDAELAAAVAANTPASAPAPTPPAADSAAVVPPSP